MRRSAPGLVLALLALAACDPYPRPPTSAPAPAAASPQAARITPQDFRRLRWGTWRGAGVVRAAFYERYRFATTRR